MRGLTVLLVLCLAACGRVPGPVAAHQAAAASYGQALSAPAYDQALPAPAHPGAPIFSAWAFASPAATSGNPINAARAVATLEYLTQEMRDSPHWTGVDAAVKARLRLARDQMRQVIGIKPDAPPRLVINAMLMVEQNLRDGDRKGALEVLSSSLFTASPDRTLHLLSSLPYAQTA